MFNTRKYGVIVPIRRLIGCMYDVEFYSKGFCNSNCWSEGVFLAFKLNKCSNGICLNFLIEHNPLFYNDKFRLCFIKMIMLIWTLYGMWEILLPDRITTTSFRTIKSKWRVSYSKKKPFGVSHEPNDKCTHWKWLIKCVNNTKQIHPSEQSCPNEKCAIEVVWTHNTHTNAHTQQQKM